MFFAVLRLIFALETKIAPPPLEIELKLEEDPDMMSTSKNGSQRTAKKRSEFRRRPFFWRSPEFGHIKALNLEII